MTSIIERCAKVADEWAKTEPVSGPHAALIATVTCETARQIAAAIRSLSSKTPEDARATPDELEDYYDNLHNFHDAMRAAISASGVSAQEIARKLSVDEDELKEHLHGKRPVTLKTLSRIASAISCGLRLTFVSHSKTPEDEDGWKPIESAAKENYKTVRLRLKAWTVRAFWDDELQRWVLARPCNFESVGDSAIEGWQPEPAPPLSSATGKEKE